MSQRALSLGGPATLSVRRTRPDLVNASPTPESKPTVGPQPARLDRATLLDRALLRLLPQRSVAWQELVGGIGPEQVYFWVRESHFVEFADTGRLWSAISRSGEIIHYAGSQPPSRTLLLSADALQAIHARAPLIPITRSGNALYRFAAPGEPALTTLDDV